MIVSPKRSLGQNFFTNENLAKKIVSLVQQHSIKNVLEIGPGTGVFTHLLHKENNVVSIEKDLFLSDLLIGHFKNKSVKIIKADVLEIDKNSFGDLFDGEKYVVFGSLPYNKSKKIIEHLLLNSEANLFYFIIQKEVAEKYISSRSNIIKARTEVFANCRKLFDISKGNFNPQPKVTSSLIQIERRSEQQIPNSDYEKFTNFLETSFRHPRKNLYNNLKDTPYIQYLTEDLKKFRPEQLNTDQLVQIFYSSTNNK